MGIEGLLRSLKEVTVKKHLREYRGKTVGIDTYVWLHRIVKGQCASEIYEGRLTDRFVKECLSRLQVFQTLGVNLLLVFDGGKLPSKAGEQQTRQQKREQCRNKAKEFLAMGQLDLAKKKMAEAFDVSPDVAYRLIVALKQKKIPFIVAPYEADAQLAYLSRAGIVDVVITEDSDLLAFGARSVLYKFDYRDYFGEEITLERLCENKTPYLRDFNHCMFLTACIFSGCDYLNQVRGVGPTGAFQLISRNRNGKAALRELRSSAKQVPSDYQQNFIKAFLTFRFQRVYCPRQKKCIMLNNVDIPTYVKQELARIRQANINQHAIVEWSDEILDQYLLEELDSNPKRDMAFIGTAYSADLTIKIAEGYLNPCTFQPYSPPSIQRPFQTQMKSTQLQYQVRRAARGKSKESGQIKLTDMGIKHSKSQVSSSDEIMEEKKTNWPKNEIPLEVPKPKLLFKETKEAKEAKEAPSPQPACLTFQGILNSELLKPMFPPTFVSDIFRS